MANPTKGEVAFDAGGESYTLVFGYNQICEMEDEFDTTMEKIGEVLNDARSIRRTMQIGLSRHHELSLEETGDIITAVGAAKAGSLIADAFAASFPEETSNPRPTKPRKAGAKR